MTPEPDQATDMREITVTSSLDASDEPSLFWHPGGDSAVPLLVGLHTWSCDRFNQVHRMLPKCKELGWALLLPEFRGPNLLTNPRATEACASRLARQDVIDAVEHACVQHSIDRKAILLLGGSGGGHMSLMLAAYRPTLWRAVSSWCPITHLAAWHSENAGYAQHVAACCGGRPGITPDVYREYFERSPVNHAAQIARARVFVHHGRHDPSVPYTHTTNLVNQVEALHASDFYFEIFDGNHELRYDQAFDWLQASVRNNAGQRNLTG